MKGSLVACCLAALALVASAEHWSVTDEASNMTCIVLEGDISFILYEQVNGTQHTFALNSSLAVEGSCGKEVENKTMQTIKINFLPLKESTSRPWSLELRFNSDDKAKRTFELVDYELITARNSIWNSTVTYHKAKDFIPEMYAQETNGFQCTETQYSLDDGKSSFTIAKLRVIAFAQLQTADFPSSQVFEQCARDSRTSEVVPIVVGACLAGLVVVVLVAYLIGRARAKRQGYSSV